MSILDTITEALNPHPYFFAVSEYGDMIPETIRRSETEAIKAACEVCKIDEAALWRGGMSIASVSEFSSFDPQVEGKPAIQTWVRGYRSGKDK